MKQPLRSEPLRFGQQRMFFFFDFMWGCGLLILDFKLDMRIKNRSKYLPEINMFYDSNPYVLYVGSASMVRFR